MRDAYELDENNSLARAVLANALVEQAHSTVDAEWREAEKLAKEALELNPAHPMAKTIKTLILDHKKEAFVEECVAQARKLQTTADLAGALARIQEGLSSYPREPRLLQLQETIQRDLQAQRRQARRRDVEELRRIETETDSAADSNTKQAIGDRVRAIANKYSTDGEILSLANGLLNRLGFLQVERKNSTTSPESDSATLTYHTPTPSADGPSFDATSKIAEPALGATAIVAPPAAVVAPLSRPPQASASSPSTGSTAPKAAPPASAGKPAAKPRRYVTALIASAAAIVLLAATFGCEETSVCQQHPQPPHRLQFPLLPLPLRQPRLLLLPNLP